MKRLCVLFVVGAIALTGCKKKDDADNKAPKKEPTPSTKVQHGKGEGKGTGGGDKTATGTMNAKPGSGKTGDGPGTGATPDQGDPMVARGAYLATGVAACALCHTPLQAGAMAPDMTKLFAGGLEMPDAFGMWRGPNITNDPDTGIGKWTDEQVIAAIRQGVRPDGTALHPIMPYPFFNKMTDDDVKAIVAFLRTGVKPVNNKVELSTDLKRPPQGMPAPTGNVDAKDDPVKHGEYLATLMHCAACHTPYVGEGKDMQPDMSKAYSGGFAMEFPPEMGMGTGTLYSPNLTNHETGLAKWTEADIVTALRTLTRPDGRPIFGPMQFYAGMWKQVSDEDMAAIAKYIKSIPGVDHKVPDSTYKPPPGPPPGAADPKAPTEEPQP
jgi:mono/diheme cytochrome c family protein